MSEIMAILVFSVGYAIGAYSMHAASRQERGRMKAMREQAARDLRRAGKLYGLVLRALCGAQGHGGAEGTEHDEGETDDEPV